MSSDEEVGRDQPVSVEVEEPLPGERGASGENRGGGEEFESVDGTRKGAGVGRVDGRASPSVSKEPAIVTKGKSWLLFLFLLGNILTV